MKEYRIIKYNNFYAIANKDDIKNYSNTHFLPYEKAMKHKKYLVQSIETLESFNKFKNNTDYKTITIY